MEEKKPQQAPESEGGQGGKPAIDKEYLKKLAEKIKAEKAKKEAAAAATSEKAPAPSAPQAPSMPKPPTPPRPMSAPHLADDDDENEGMAAEKTAIIDLASLSGHSSDARLTIIDGKDEGKSIDITRDEIFCGRSLDNDFVISDISVSRKHFKIIHEGDAYKAEDMGSGNGIRVNGKKDSSVILYDGDLITAGARTIKFEYLNQSLKEKYSRKQQAVAVDMDDMPAPRAKTPVLLWVLVGLLVVVVGVVVFMLTSQQKQIEKAVATGPGLEELDKIDLLIDEHNFVEAEKLIASMLFKSPNSKFLLSRQEVVLKEKNHVLNFENGKKALTENKPEEAEKFFRMIPEDSVFRTDIVSLIGKEKVEGWALLEVEELIKANKTDEAIKKLSAILVDNPGNQKAKDLQTNLINQVGAQKVQTIQKDVEEKKKEEAKAAEERRQRVEKARKANPNLVVKKAERKPVIEKPKEEKPADSYTMSDIDSAIDTYVSKDFDGAIAKLEKMTNTPDKEVREKAKLIIDKIKKFKTAYEDKNSKKCILLDKMISGGKLKDELADLNKKGSSGGSDKPKKEESSSSSSEASSGASEDNTEQAKTLYMEGVSLKDSSPEKAKEKFEEVLKIVPKDNKYYKKAKKALKEM